MQSNPASKPQVARGRKSLNAPPPKDYRSELQNALKLSPPGGHLDAVIALYKCDPIKLKKSYEQIRRCIENGLRDKVTVKLPAFGSLVTGLALQDSDIDLYVREYSNPPMPKSQLYAVLMNFLTTNKYKKFIDVAKVPRTREPIIRCKHRLSKLNLNIHVSCPNGAYNSEFIGDLMRSSKILRDLSLFLKIWSNNQIEGCGISNYCLLCMIIGSLQKQGLLPTVQQMQAGCPPKTFRGINYAYSLLNVRPISEQANILDLIGYFFDLYSTIDFEKMAVTPFLGGVMDKQPFRDDEIPEYTAQMVAMKRAGAEPTSPFRMITCMYVQDPFDMQTNVAQSVSPVGLSWIKKGFSLASRVTKDPKLRAQPEQLYDYLLFGMADQLEEMQNEEESKMWAYARLMKQTEEHLSELEEEESANNKLVKQNVKEPTKQKEKDLTKQEKKGLKKWQTEEPCCSTNKLMKQEDEEPCTSNKLVKQNVKEPTKQKEKELPKQEKKGLKKRKAEEPCCSTNKLMKQEKEDILCEIKNMREVEMQQRNKKQPAKQKERGLTKQKKKEPSFLTNKQMKQENENPYGIKHYETKKMRKIRKRQQKEKGLTKKNEKGLTKQEKEEPCCSTNKLIKQEKEEPYTEMKKMKEIDMMKQKEKGLMKQKKEEPFSTQKQKRKNEEDDKKQVKRKRNT